jgi:hypothetical protein
MSCRRAGVLIIGLGVVAACGDAAREEPFMAGSGAGTGAITTGENHTVPVSGNASAGASGGGGAGVGGSASAAGKGGAGSSGSPGVKASAGAGAGGAGAAAGSGGAAAGGGGGHAGAAAGGGGGGSMSVLSGPSQCAGSELLLCEGFESASLDSSIWSTMMSKPSIDDARAARGGKSLHVHTTATGASGIQTTKIFPRAEGHYYGRMFVYFDALPTSPQWAHWTIVGANPKSGSGEIRVGGQHDGKIERFGVGTDQGPTGDWTNLDEDPKSADAAVPLKKWLCVEWLHDWMNDQTKFYLDGTEHPSLATTPDVDHGGNSNVKYEIPELGSVWVGFWNYNQGKPVMPSEFDVWIDEVAFDDERIGCER